METNIKQIILWGHKLHSHTHSYIHFGFKKGFEYLGYKTYWFDNNDDISNFDFTSSLFITEGQVDKNIPIRDDCYYVLHNVNFDKYKELSKKNIIIIQVYTNDVYKHNAKPLNNKKCFYLEQCIFMPWATDLLPHEINKNIELVNNNKIICYNGINFVGMPVEPWDKVKEFCKINNIKFSQVGGFSLNNISSEDNMKLIQQSILAPAVQCKWQTDNGYIPCRIFKNISYGKMGLTNNKVVNELFDNKLIYSDNINELMKMGIQFEKLNQKEKLKRLIPLMEDVRDNHTYLNRINLIFRYFTHQNI
jgi:hypothetical protein